MVMTSERRKETSNQETLSTFETLHKEQLLLGYLGLLSKFVDLCRTL